MPVFLQWLLRLGPMNPIAVRLVQNGSRRPRHLYIRATYLAVLIIALLWLLLLSSTGANTFSYKQLAQAGARAFTIAAYLQVLLICVLAPVFMGGAIAQEANPRNWEVLLTTPMTASEIVLGNLFGRLFFILALLTASLPLFALTQYFGGVPYGAVFSSYLVAGSAALVVGTIAIALSVSRLVGKRAFFVFYVCVISYLGLTYALDAWMALTGRGAGAAGKGVTLMTALNPFLALRALLNPTSYPRADPGTYSGVTGWMLEQPVTTWCVGATLLSVVFMIISVFTVRAGGLQTLTTDAEGVPLHRKLFGMGPSKRLSGHRAPRGVWTNPIAWREAASRNSTGWKIIVRYAFLGLGALLGPGLVWFYHTGALTPAEFQFALVAFVWSSLMVIALVAINTAATAISKEREDGTLDLLLTTPITASAYLKGKLRGLITYMLPMLAVPLGTLACAAIYILIMLAAGSPKATVPMSVGTGTTPVPLILPESALLTALVVIPFLAFCVMVGLQWSLKSRGTISSVVWTVGVVGVVSGIVGVCAWSSGTISVLGPVLGALSPASYVRGVAYPDALIGATANTSLGLWGARILLLVGAAAAALLYGAICYGIHSNMVRTFDMTVRKLAGVR